jgi:4-amino-4-deoxy-L-arabinose transferase-like glycosyltransferase
VSRETGKPRTLMFGRTIGPADIMVAAGLMLLVFVLLIYRSDSLWLQYWDESRIANNALEAAMDGHWLAPTYHGVVDHWNTKPPLLVWLVAILLKAGLPPLWALRLPNIFAASATCGLIWATLRFALKDAAAAALGAVLLLSSVLFIGIHASRTGDYDGLESLFILGYVLSLWAAYTEPVKPNWLALAAFCIVGAVMTKGVAGALALPGCALFFLTSPTRLWKLIKDARSWVWGFATVAICLGYYLTREAYDPGYLQAINHFELGGRFQSVSDGHAGPPLFYVGVLFASFEPGWVLAPLALVALLGPSGRRRDLAVITLASALAVLVVLSCSKTKIFWYATPAVPLLSIAAGIGVTDALRRIPSRRLPWRGLAGATVFVVCAIDMAAAIYQSQRWVVTAEDTLTPAVRDGRFITYLHGVALTPPLIVMDERLWGPTPFGGSPDRRFSQIVDFYARYYRGHWPIAEADLGDALPPGATVMTCSGKVLSHLNAGYGLIIITRQYGCTLARIASQRRQIQAGRQL